MAHDSIDIAQTMAVAATRPSGGDGYSFKVDDVLGQYRIVRPLGRGGMGEVYLVEHEILTTRYALKLLPEERSTFCFGC